MSFLKTLTVDSRQKPWFDFDSPPPIGFELRVKWFKTGVIQTLTLEKAEDHIRRYDGAESFRLTWRDQRGVEYTSGLKGQPQKKRAHVFEFDSPPAVGYRLTHRLDGVRLDRPLTVEKVEPYERKRDGGSTYLITWRDDKGRLYESGMRGRYPHRKSFDEAEG